MIKNVGPIDRVLLDLMQKGDARAKYAIGTPIEKVDGETQDHHMTGTKGIVKGNIHSEEGDAYLVHFERDAEHVLTFIIDKKIKEVINP